MHLRAEEMQHWLSLAFWNFLKGHSGSSTLGPLPLSQVTPQVCPSPLVLPPFPNFLPLPHVFLGNGHLSFKTQVKDLLHGALSDPLHVTLHVILPVPLHRWEGTQHQAWLSPSSGCKSLEVRTHLTYFLGGKIL